MLQNLSEEIRERLRRAEECKQKSKIAVSPSAIQDYLEMEQRWLTLARGYEFSERLSNSPSRSGSATGRKGRPLF